MFSTDVAKAINWIGKDGKTAFSTLKIKDVLTATVRKNRLCSSATDSEIFEVAKNWFRFESDSDGGVSICKKGYGTSEPLGAYSAKLLVWFRTKMGIGPSLIHEKYSFYGWRKVGG
uniref:Uncharacterized protein n=1 Tax=Magallana gigas TaxID=29159 RepID=K1PUL1_MAGGI